MNHLYGRLRKMNRRKMNLRMMNRRNSFHHRNSCHRCLKMICRMNSWKMNGMILRNIRNRFQRFSVRALSMFPDCCMTGLISFVQMNRMKSCFSECFWMFLDMPNAVFRYRC